MKVDEQCLRLTHTADNDIVNVLRPTPLGQVLMNAIDVVNVQEATRGASE